MASDWTKFYTKAGLLLFYFNEKTAEHRWPDWANNDVCQSEAIKSIEINSDWMGFLCKSDELLFYYDKKTKEHRWPDLSVNYTFENAIPADGKPPYEDVSTQTALEELHEKSQNDQLHSASDTWTLSDAKSDTVEVSIDQPKQEDVDSFTFVSRTDRQQDFDIKEASSLRSTAKKDRVLDIGSSKAGESQINLNSDDYATSSTNVDIELLDAPTENSIISKELNEPALNTNNEGIHNGYKDGNHNSDNRCNTTSNAADIGFLHEPIEDSVVNKHPNTTKMNNKNAINEKICDGKKVNLYVENQFSTAPNFDTGLQDAPMENCVGCKDLNATAMNASNANANNDEIHCNDVGNLVSDNPCFSVPNNVETELLDAPLESSVANKDLAGTAMSNANVRKEKIPIGRKLNSNSDNKCFTAPTNVNTELLNSTANKDLDAASMNAGNGSTRNEEILGGDKGNLDSDNRCTTEAMNADIELVDEPMEDSVIHKDLDAAAATNGNAKTGDVHDGNKLHHNSGKRRTTETTNADIELLDEPMEESLVNKDLDAVAVNSNNNDARNEEINGVNKPIKEENCDEYPDYQGITGTANTNNDIKEQRNSTSALQNPQLSNANTATTNTGLPTEEERKENSQSCNNQSSTNATNKNTFEEQQTKQHSHNSTDASKSNTAKPPRKRPYKCKVCGKTFDRGHRFDRHARTHAKGAITCHKCGEIFPGKVSLSNHMNTHSGTKSHQCKTCGKCFTQAGNLLVHERVHTGVKPYKCDFCGKKFSQIGNLRAHIRIHTGDTPYHCKLCDGKFRQLSHLISHEKSFHKLKR